MIEPVDTDASQHPFTVCEELQELKQVFQRYPHGPVASDSGTSVELGTNSATKQAMGAEEPSAIDLTAKEVLVSDAQGRTKRDEDSLQTLGTLQEKLAKCKETAKTEDFDTAELAPSMLEAWLEVLNWRTEALRFLTNSKATGSEVELNALIEASRHLKLSMSETKKEEDVPMPEIDVLVDQKLERNEEAGEKEQREEVEELARLKRLREQYGAFKEEFKAKIGDASARSAHHTRSRTRKAINAKQEVRPTEEDLSHFKALISGAFYMMKYSPDLLQYLSRIEELEADISPMKLSLAEHRRVVQEKRKAYELLKLRFNSLNPQYDFSQQYLHLNTFTVKNLKDTFLASVPIQNVKLQVDDLESLCRVFYWYQRARKEFNGFVDSVGILDLGKVDSSTRLILKQKVADFYKEAPSELKTRLEKEKIYLPKNIRQARLSMTSTRAYENSKRIAETIAKPYKFGAMEILSLGKVDSSPGFHNADYIYPVGFTSKKRYTDNLFPSKKTDYINKIINKRGEPEFLVYRLDDPTQKWIGATPTGAYTALQNAIGKRQRELNLKVTNTGFSGPIMFGLNLRQNDTIQRLIESLEGSLKCREYQFIDQRMLIDSEDAKRALNLGFSDEDDEEKRRFLYQAEELMLLAGMVKIVQGKRNQKAKLFAFLNINNEMEQKELPNIFNRRFVSRISALAQQAATVLTISEQEACEKLKELSEIARGLKTGFKTYQNAVQDKVETFKDLCLTIEKLLKSGFYPGALGTIQQKPNIFHYKLKSLSNLFPKLAHYFTMFVNLVQSPRSPPVEAHIMTWRQNFKGKWMYLRLEGKKRLALSLFYEEATDLSEVFIEVPPYQDALKLYPGGVALTATEDVKTFHPADMTFSGKQNYLTQFYEDSAAATSRGSTSHAAYDTEDILNRKLFIYYSYSEYDAVVRNYYPGLAQYQVEYPEPTGENRFEAVKLFPDGKGMSLESSVYGELFVYRFKRDNEPTLAEALLENSAELGKRREGLSRAEVGEDPEALDETYFVESDDYSSEELESVVNEADNLKDYNKRGPLLRKKLCVGEPGHEGKARLEHESMPLYKYASTRLRNLKSWSESQKWFQLLQRQQQSVSSVSRSADPRRSARVLLKKVIGLGVEVEDEKKVDLVVFKLEKLLSELKEDDKKYRERVRSLAQNLKKNAAVRMNLLTDRLAPEKVCTMTAADFQDEETKKEREAKMKRMDDSIFLVKPEKASITPRTQTEDQAEEQEKALEKRASLVFRPQESGAAPELSSDLEEDSLPTETAFEVASSEQALASVKEKEEEKGEKAKEDSEMQKRAKPIRFLLVADLLQFRTSLHQETDEFLVGSDQGTVETIDPEILKQSLVRELKRKSRWSGLLDFPSTSKTQRFLTDVSDDVVSASAEHNLRAKCTLELISSSSSLCSSPALQEAQSCFFSALPSVLKNKAELLEGLEQVPGYGSVTLSCEELMFMDLDKYAEFLDNHLVKSKDELIIMATIKCRALEAQYDDLWCRDFKIGVFNMVETHGFEMFVFPPLFDEEERAPKLIQRLPFALRKRYLAVIHVVKNLENSIYLPSTSGSSSLSNSDVDFEGMDLRAAEKFSLRELVRCSYEEESGRLSGSALESAIEKGLVKHLDHLQWSVEVEANEEVDLRLEEIDKQAWEKEEEAQTESGSDLRSTNEPRDVPSSKEAVKSLSQENTEAKRASECEEARERKEGGARRAELREHFPSKGSTQTRKRRQGRGEGTKKRSRHEMPVCRFFSKPGGCRNGEHCKFSHARRTEDSQRDYY